MAVRNFSVRVFQIDRGGALEPLLSTDEDHFAGAVPNVGDTLASWGFDGTYSFFSVQRRIFIEAARGDHGWLVIVRAIDAAPLLEEAATAWNEDTKFWAEIEERELEEEQERLSGERGTLEWWRRQRDERDKHKPIHGLDGREQGVLRFMILHPEQITVGEIPRAGEKTMEKLLKVGVVREGSKNSLGLRTWLVTEEGKAEIDRADTWKNWKVD